MADIVRFGFEHIDMLPQPEQPIDVIGQMVLRYDGASWQMGEKLFAEKQVRNYPDDRYDPYEYVDSDECAAFLALEGDERIGSLRVRKNWNRTAFVEDIKVDRAWRGRGVGTQLMDAARAWSRDNGLYGLSLETQDWNVLACRFYIKYGFELSGLDTRLYYAFKHARDEHALFFYLPPNLPPNASNRLISIFNF